MQIRLQVSAIQITQILWYRCFSLIPCNGLQCCLYLLFTPLTLVCMNNFFPLFEICFFSFIQVYSKLLVDFRHLFAKVTASGVNHQVSGSITCLIYFNKVIAASQSPQAQFQPLYISQFLKAGKRLKSKCFLPFFPYRHP